MNSKQQLAITGVLFGAVVFMGFGGPFEARHSDALALEPTSAGTVSDDNKAIPADRSDVDGDVPRIQSGDDADTPLLGATVESRSSDAVDVISKDGWRYSYDKGLWFIEDQSGWNPVRPPAGTVVSTLPASSTTAWVEGMPYYYAQGVYYVPVVGGYAIANPLSPS